MWGASPGVPTSTLGTPLETGRRARELRVGGGGVVVGLLGRKPGWSRPDAPRSDLGLFKFSVLCQGDQLSCNLPPTPLSPRPVQAQWQMPTAG